MNPTKRWRLKPPAFKPGDRKGDELEAYLQEHRAELDRWRASVGPIVYATVICLVVNPPLFPYVLGSGVALLLILAALDRFKCR